MRPGMSVPVGMLCLEGKQRRENVVTDHAIWAEGLVKRFGETTALDGVDLAVRTGTVLGLLGPNGAGKTTAIRVLLGLLRADAGRAELLGGDPWRDAVGLHRRLAYVPGDVELWPNLTGGEAIDLLGAERIGHGIGVLHDPSLMDHLMERGLPLEICPTSNLRTGALGRQLGAEGARLDRHPLKAFFDRGLQVVLSTDDPAMFETDLLGEYRVAAALGFSPAELARLAKTSFSAALLPQAERRNISPGSAARRPGSACYNLSKQMPDDCTRR